jgi:iron complex outermembrane receptor protein
MPDKNVSLGPMPPLTMRYLWLPAVSIFGFCAVATTVQAQSSPEGSAAGDLQEIVVTAEKRESTVQTTPFSITAISGAQLVEQGLASIEGVAAQTPGISMKQFSPGQTEYEMRGLPSSGGSSATVGFYLNDVPMAGAAQADNGKEMIDPDLFDLERVEVLRGPQGTLYGAGSMGGTIRLITAPPEFNKLSGASQTIASFTEHGGFNRGESAMINLPIVDDRLAVRLVGTTKYNDGWIDRDVVSPFPLGPGGTCGWSTCTRGDVQNAPLVARTTDANWERVNGGRGAIRFQATDALTIDAMVMYQGISSGNFPQVDESVGINQLTNYQPFDIATPFKDTFKVYSLTVNYDMGFAKLTSDTSDWSHDSTWIGDYSETGEYLFNTYFGLKAFVPVPYYDSDPVERWAQEFRLVSEGDGSFQWLVGGFVSGYKSAWQQYFASPTYAPVSTGGSAANPLGIGFQANTPYRETEYAGFGEVNYDITHTLKVTAGLRWYKYDTRVNVEQEGIFAQTGNASAFLDTIITNATGFNPKFNLSYEPNSHLTLYAQVAKGFRPGGVNTPIPNPPCAINAPQSFTPDSIWNYEVGEKARLLDGKLSINGDVFYIRWNNVQQALDEPCGFPFTDNVGVAESYGPELEIAAQISPEFSVSLNGSYTQAHLTSINPALLGTTIGTTEVLEPGDALLNVPRYDVSSALTYSYPISNGYKLTGRLSETTTGPFYDLNYNVQRLPGYTLANARVGLIADRWSLYLVANNLTNDIAILTINTHAWNTPTPALTQPSVTTPRTIGLEFNYKF